MNRVNPDDPKRGAPMKRYIAISIAATLTLAALGDENRPNKEAQKLQGSWKLVKFDTPPQRRPPEEFVAKGRLVFDNNKLITRIGTRVTEETTFTIDGTKTPKWLDVVATVGPLKGKIAKGIYELKLNGDDLKICIGLPGQQRPTEFKVAADVKQQAGVMFFKREKR
jgi:uncharacterized protein (TIGR03067 family)